MPAITGYGFGHVTIDGREETRDLIVLPDHVGTRRPGTVTFLLTDVEGSTKLLDELGAEAYAIALAEHRRIARRVCRGDLGRSST